MADPCVVHVCMWFKFVWQIPVWFTCGCASLAAQKYESAVRAFKRCVNIDYDVRMLLVWFDQIGKQQFRHLLTLQFSCSGMNEILCILLSRDVRVLNAVGLWYLLSV